MNPAHQCVCHCSVGFLTGQNRHNFVAPGQHLSQQTLACFQQAFFGCYDLGIGDADIVAGRNFQIVEHGVANRIRDLARLHMLYGVLHVILIGLHAFFLLESKRCGNPLRDTLARDNGNAAFPFKQIARLLSGQDNIGVVRQHKHVLSRNRLDRLNEILGARVHRLPTGQNDIDTQAGEDFRNALARSNGDKSIRCQLIGRQTRWIDEA
ncbi:hypothetical protein D3C81_1605060 [compost metagenome]